jgi:hypothetical protein
MLERRRKESHDTGARTRRTDREGPSHSLHDWMTTFNLRWVEHLKRRDRNGRPYHA